VLMAMATLVVTGVVSQAACGSGGADTSAGPATNFDSGLGKECEHSSQCATGLYCQFKYSADLFKCSKPRCADQIGGC
jgi:hypothetical protein